MERAFQKSQREHKSSKQLPVSLLDSKSCLCPEIKAERLPMESVPSFPSERVVFLARVEAAGFLSFLPQKACVSAHQDLVLHCPGGVEGALFMEEP